jgi:hypothetical protein
MLLYFLAMNHTLVEKAHLVKVNCGLIQDYPFLMHSGVIIDWVCNNEGEHRVTVVMMYVFEKYNKNKENNSSTKKGTHVRYRCQCWIL